MSLSLSLYRKYRPGTFTDMIGQEHIETTLRNAILTGSVSHAYLFCGPRGTGKTTTARLLAKALLCEKAPTDQPDGTCLACREIADGIHPDVYELDAASRTGVENVREEIIGRVQFAPTHGAYKIYIIDEVHMLSTAAFNALLKTLEEPPSHVKFILCTTDPHKVPATIQSRCQRFDFRRLSEPQIVQRLQHICTSEGYTYELDALSLIAQRSSGGMRDAIGGLEQVAVFSAGAVTLDAAENMLGEASIEQLFSLTTLIAQRNVAASFAWVASFTQSGTDIARFVSDLSAHVRNLYVAAVLGDDRALTELLEADKAQIQRYREQAQLFGSADRLAYVLTVLGDLGSQLHSTSNARLALEIALTRLARPDSDLTLESLAARIAILEANPQSTTLPPLREAPPQPTPVTPAPLREANPQPIPAAPPLPEAPAGGEAAIHVAAPRSMQPSQSEPTPTHQPVSVTEPAASPSPSLQAASTASDTAIHVTAPEPSQPSQPDHPTAPDPDLQPAVPSDLSPDLARRILLQVDKDLSKAKKFSVAALLGGAIARPDPKTNGLIIELPSDASFARQNLERQDNYQLIGTLIERAYGQKLPFSYVLGTIKPVPSSKEPEALPFQESPSPLIPEPDPQPVTAAFPSLLENPPQPIISTSLQETNTASNAAIPTGAPEPTQPSPLIPEPDPQPQPAPASEPDPQPQLAPAPAPEPQPQPAPAPEPDDPAPGSSLSFEEILSASFGAAIQVDEVNPDKP